ncbi:hypothetical protein CIPAW_10G007400 [Carya illinoinensis]|uniref:Reverse transcriptase domain-containing protein n=1 Tax=Carya illinoinensis TaxID=32201 RepID=A0A8T1P8F5_CARIL|nr:hypothetical protein CIPAW_10G007400 [Carya illinoinensis]
MYVDDIVIFVNGGKRSMKALIQVLNTYEDWSGQVLNKGKTAIFFYKHISIPRKSSIFRITDFSESSFPFKYLGVLILIGRLKVSNFGDLLRKVKKKIAGWKMKLHFVSGRTILLLHVLSRMTTHLQSYMSLRL